MLKSVLSLAFAVLGFASIAHADPIGFEVNLEIDGGGKLSNSSVTVEEGVEGTLTTRDETGNVVREVKLTVEPASDTSALLTLVITEPSIKHPSESSMEVTYGVTGSMTQSTPTGSRSVKATIQRLTPTQLNDIKASIGAAPACGTETGSVIELNAPQQPNAGCCSLRCPWGT